MTDTSTIYIQDIAITSSTMFIHLTFCFGQKKHTTYLLKPTKERRLFLSDSRLKLPCVYFCDSLAKITPLRNIRVAFLFLYIKNLDIMFQTQGVRLYTHKYMYKDGVYMYTTLVNIAPKLRKLQVNRKWIPYMSIWRIQGKKPKKKTTNRTNNEIYI